MAKYQKKLQDLEKLEDLEKSNTEEAKEKSRKKKPKKKTPMPKKKTTVPKKKTTAPKKKTPKARVGMTDEEFTETVEHLQAGYAKLHQELVEMQDAEDKEEKGPRTRSKKK